jgi:hypothetical protein
MSGRLAAVLGFSLGAGCALGCGSTSSQGDAAEYRGPEETPGDALHGAADTHGAECDAGLSDPGLYDAGSSPEALADDVRRRSACSLTVQVTRRGKPLTLDYAIK